MSRSTGDKKPKGGMTIRDVEKEFGVKFRQPPEKKFITYLKEEGFDSLAYVWKKIDRRK